jgi:DNA-binding GntR family transcriptional regulator
MILKSGVKGPRMPLCPPLDVRRHWVPLSWDAVNKQERTYTILRDRIHVGAYPPEARLNIDALARELGVSPIPVREALRRLEAEGWVHFRRNVGAIVAPVDATSWEQAMVALAILEGAASAEAKPYLRKSDFTRLLKLASEMADPATRADPLRFSGLNRALHAAIVARCPNSYLLELLERTHVRLDRVRSTMFVYLPHRSSEAVAEHARLIELLQQGDASEVEQYARWHKLQTVEAYRAIHQANDKAVAARQQLPVTSRGQASQPA